MLYYQHKRNTGIINQNAEYIRRGMFDWSEDEEKSFYRGNIERIAKDLKVKEWYLEIPYLLWSVFALVLSISIYLMN